MIAEQAGVTKSLLHHYFGDKQGLWAAVKDASVESYAQQQRKLFAGDSGAEDIASSITAYFSFLQSHPEIARMFALESFDSEYKPSATEQELQAKGIAFINDLQRKKVLRDDIDADVILALFSALTEHWFISRDRVAQLNGTKPGRILDARYFEAVRKIFKSGLQMSRTK